MTINFAVLPKGIGRGTSLVTTIQYRIAGLQIQWLGHRFLQRLVDSTVVRLLTSSNGCRKFLCINQNRTLAPLPLSLLPHEAYKISSQRHLSPETDDEGHFLKLFSWRHGK